MLWSDAMADATDKPANLDEALEQLEGSGLAAVDDHADADAETIPATPVATAAASAEPMHIALRIALGAAGLCLLIGFFLPWMSLPSETPTGSEIVQISGLSIVAVDSAATRLVMGDGQRLLVLAVPAFGLALTAIGFLGFRWAGPIALVCGVVVVGYGVARLIILFFQVTGVGLWLVVIGALTAIIAGAIAWGRLREDAARRRALKAAAKAAKNS